MGGGFRRKDAFDTPAAEAFLVLRKPLREVISHERRGDRATRRNTEPAADHRRTQQSDPVARHLFPDPPHHAQADACRVPRSGRRSVMGRRSSVVAKSPITGTGTLKPGKEA